MDIRHDVANRRLEAVVDGAHCVLEYQLEGDVMTINHTGVPPQVGGRGIAGALVARAYEIAASEGWRVVPACSYAAAWAARHPELTDAARP
jgi:predicted GNAT family acetyltransferase